MKCPSCTGELKVSDRQGVEVDYCPACRGVWLDRGELDKIIERSSIVMSRRHREAQYDDDDDNDYARETYGGKRKRRSWLGELFDFGD